MYFHLALGYAYNRLKRDYIPIGKQAGSRARQTVWTEGCEQEVAWLRIELSNYSTDCQVSRRMYNRLQVLVRYVSASERGLHTSRLDTAAFKYPQTDNDSFQLVKLISAANIIIHPSPFVP